MAEGGLKRLGCLPSGRGQVEALHSLLSADSVVTALTDSSLRAVRGVPEDGQCCPFVDLVGRFLMMMGAPSGLLASSRAMEELHCLACEEAEDEHPLLNGISRRPGMVRAIISALSEIHLAGLDPATIREAAQKLSPHLKEKLEALASVDSRVRSRLAALGRELPSERIKRCLSMEMEVLGPIRHIVVLAGRERQPLFWEWLEWAARQGVKVDVLVESLPGRIDLFQSRHKLDKPLKLKKPRWIQSLFSQETAADPAEVRLIRAPDQLAECEWALRLCSRLINQGIFPHRLAIYCRDTESYAPLLSMASDRLGVPLSLALTVDLPNVGIGRIVIQTLRILSGTDVRPLGRLCGSSYYPATAAERKWLSEALSDAYRARESAWDTLFLKLEEGEGPAWLTHLLTWRSEAKDAVLTLAEWQGRLKDLLGESVVNEEAAKVIATKERDLRALHVLLAALSAGAGASPEAKLTFGGFVQKAISLWSKDKVHLPANDDGVRVESMTERLGPCEALIVLGVVEGSLPRGRSEDPVLSDTERISLMEACGIEGRLVLSAEKAEEERDEFVRLCASPSELLVMTWPHVKDQRNTIPAFYLKELERALEGRLHKEIHSIDEMVPRPDEAAFGEAPLAEAWHGESYAGGLEVFLRTEEARSRVKADLSEPQPLDAVADACQCPFRSLGRHRLNWRGPSGEYEISRMTASPRRGSMRFSQTPEDLRIFLTYDYEERITQAYPRLQEWQIPLLTSARDRLVEEWTDAEVRIRRWLPLNEWQFEVTEKAPWFEQRPWRTPHGNLKLKFTLPAGLMTQDGLLALDGGRRPPTKKEWQDWVKGGAEPNGSVWVGIIFALTEGITAQTALILRHASETNLAHRSPDPPPKKIPWKIKGDAVTEILPPPKDMRWMSLVRFRVTEGARILAEGDMAPVPGDWCSTCELGEICRSHKDYGSRGEAPE